MLKILYYNRDTIIRNIAESLVISGFPMSTKDYNTQELTREIESVYLALKVFDSCDVRGIDLAPPYVRELEPYLKRGKVLGGAKPNSGHDCYLKGVTFNVIINAPSYWYPQYQRYHFTDIISSQSKMHRLTKMDLENQCTTDVDSRVLDILNDLIEEFNQETDKAKKEVLFDKIVANTPMGLTLTCGIVINYLQIKSMLGQREPHKISEWSEDFVAFANELPLFNILTKREVK